MVERGGVYRVLVGKSEGKKPLGRLRRRWEYNIKMVCGGMDWIELHKTTWWWPNFVAETCSWDLCLVNLAYHLELSCVWRHIVYTLHFDLFDTQRGWRTSKKFKQFSAFYGLLRFNTAFSTAHHQSPFVPNLLSLFHCLCCRARAESDGARAETTFRLSPKRTSPFKSAEASVQSTTGSRGVSISDSNAGYTTFRGRVRVLATHSIRQFPLHFPSRASACAIIFRPQYTKSDVLWKVL